MHEDDRYGKGSRELCGLAHGDLLIATSTFMDTGVVF